MQNKALYCPEYFQITNEIMIAEDYDDTKKLNFFCSIFFTFLIVVIKRV